jgi:hypothetical protein
MTIFCHHNHHHININIFIRFFISRELKQLNDHHKDVDVLVFDEMKE